MVADVVLCEDKACGLLFVHGVLQTIVTTTPNEIQTDSSTLGQSAAAHT